MGNLLNMSGGGLLKKGSLIPSGYRQLEYIESTGTQYIDTGIVGNVNTEYEITVKTNISPVSAGVNAYAIFGSRTSATENNIESIYSSIPEEGVTTDFGNYTVTRQTLKIPNVTAHRLKITNNKSKRTVTDLDAGWTNTVTTVYSGSLTTPTNLYIGYANSFVGLSASNLQGCIYSCKIWHNGTLARNFVPAKNPSDVIGMYDTVTNTFYTNAGTGSFIAGPEV